MTAQPDPATLRARLEASRAALLGAIARLTEQDFASDLGDGERVVSLLASLAAGERAALAAVGSGPSAPHGAASATSLAPQAIHDLAGARFETLRVLEALEGSAEPDEAAMAAMAAMAAIEPIAEREEAAAARIRARFATE